MEHDWIEAISLKVFFYVTRIICTDRIAWAKNTHIKKYFEGYMRVRVSFDGPFDLIWQIMVHQFLNGAPVSQ
jgi:hypothetical protein